MFKWCLYVVTNKAVVAQRCGGNATVVGSIPTRRNELFYLSLLLLSFLRSDTKALKTQCLNTKFPLSTLPYAGYNVNLIFYILYV